METTFDPEGDTQFSTFPTPAPAPHLDPCCWVTGDDGDEWQCSVCHEYWVVVAMERDPMQRGIMYCPFCGEKIQEFVYRMEA